MPTYQTTDITKQMLELMNLTLVQAQMPQQLKSIESMGTMQEQTLNSMTTMAAEQAAASKKSRAHAAALNIINMVWSYKDSDRSEKACKAAIKLAFSLNDKQAKEYTEIAYA